MHLVSDPAKNIQYPFAYDENNYYTLTSLPNMKRSLLSLIVILFSLSVFAQQNEEARQLTKFEQIYSQTGRLVKFQDINMQKVPSSFSVLKASIRVVMGETDTYFLRLEKPETSSSIARIAMIEYTDLVEINKALVKLCESVEEDLEAKPDYLENKFRTDDGFETGYYVSQMYQSGNYVAKWYVKLERSSKSVVQIKSQEDLLKLFSDALVIIKDLQSKRQ